MTTDLYLNTSNIEALRCGLTTPHWLSLVGTSEQILAGAGL